MAKKATAAKKKTTKTKPKPKKPAAKKPAAKAKAKGHGLLPLAVAPSIKITGVGFANNVTPVGDLADGLIFDMTTGSLVATGASLGCPVGNYVMGQLVGLDTPFTMPGMMAYNALGTRWTLTIPDNPPIPPGPGTYSVALQVWFPVNANQTPTDTAEFMVTV